MIVVPGNMILYVDIDDTLIMWSPSEEEQLEKGIYLDYPGTLSLENQTQPVRQELVVPHLKHIAQVKRHKLRGHTIVIWSAGGVDWAKKAVEVLQLQDYVDVVMCKPTWILDDKKAEEFMPKNQWQEDK